MPNPALQAGDFRLYVPGDNWVLTAISWGERVVGIDPKYAHVGFVLDPETETAAYGNGVQSGPLNQLECDILRPIWPEGGLEKAIAYARSLDGKEPYADLDLAYLAAIREFKLKHLPNFPADKMICSEYGAYILLKGGLDLWPGIQPCAVAPGDYDGQPLLVNVGRWTPEAVPSGHL